MPLECFKSLNKVQNDNKTKNIRDKYNMFYTELYDVSPKPERKHASHFFKERYNLEILNEKFPEILNMLTNKICEHENTNSQKIKRTKHKQSHSYSHEIETHSKKERKRHIPLDKEILEFSIGRTQCPMVVRIHKGHSNKHKMKQKQEKTNSQHLTQSLSYPPCIENKFKITSERKNISRKEEKTKSKHELLFHGYTLSELLRLSPTKTSLGTNSNLDTIMSIHKSNKLHSKEILKNKHKLQSSCLTNGMINTCASGNEEQVNYTSLKKSVKPHKISEKHKEFNKKTGHNKEVRRDCNSDNHKNFNQNYDRCHSVIYLKIKSPIGTTSNSDDELDLVFNTKDYEESRKEPICSPRKTSNANESQLGLHNDKNLLKCCTEDIFQDSQVDCNCQRCKRNQNETIKKRSYLTTSQCSSNILEIIQRANNTINEPHETSKPDKINSKKAFVYDNNIVILDASKSQFHRISAFLKDKNSKHNLSIDSDQLNASSSTLDKIFFSEDQEYIDHTNIKNIQHNTHGLLRKIRSEEKNLEKYIKSNNSSLNDNGSRPLINYLRHNSSFPTLNTGSPKLDCDELGKTRQSVSYYKCLRCNKSISGIMNFDPYCSDCNLKVKLSQISNESEKNNKELELKKGRLACMEQGLSLNTIPESDNFISKELVNVAIQTERILEKTVIREDKKTNFVPECSLEAAFKLYSKQAPHLKHIHEISNAEMKDYLNQYNNADLVFNQNIFDADFEREIQVKELDSNFHEENKSFSLHENLRRHSPTMENLGLPLLKSMNPNLQSYELLMIDDNLPKENYIASENNTAENNVKTTVFSFVSPLFPEKEYCKITDNKSNLCSSTKSSNNINEGKNEVKNIMDCVEEYLSRDLNFHKTCDKKPTEGSFVGIEKRTIFDTEIENINKVQYTSQKKSIGENITYLAGESKFIPQNNETPPEVLIPSLNFGNGSLPSDNNCKSLILNFNDHHKKNFRHTLPRDLSHQGLKFQSPFQTTVSHSRTIISEKSRNHEQSCMNNPENNFYIEEFQGKTLGSRRINNLPKECCQKGFESNDSTFNSSKMDFNLSYKRVECPKETGMNITNGGVGDKTKFPKVSTNNVDKYKTTRNTKEMAKETGVLDMHTLSYIYFNLVLPAGNTSDLDEDYEVQDSFETGLVLMPGTKIHSHADGLNDLLFGTNFTSLINNKLAFRTETNNEEFNVFETKALSKLSTVIGNDENVNNSNVHFVGKPLKYEAIHTNFEKNHLDEPSDVGEEVKNPNPIADKKSLKTNENCEVKVEHIKVRDNILKKMRSEIVKNTGTTKSRGEKKKFTKTNNLFMSGYLAQMSFFRFVCDLQTKMCSQLRKTKLI